MTRWLAPFRSPAILYTRMVSTATTTAARLHHRAYEHLRQRLTSGTLRDGRALSEPAVAAELGMSRTPVREAIRQLQNEGLLEQHARRGTFLRRPDRRDIEEMFQLRVCLEPMAAAEAARHADAATRRELRQGLRQMARAIRSFIELRDPELQHRLALAYGRYDMEFHIALARATGNRRLHKLFSDVHMFMLMTIPRESLREAYRDMTQSYREHEAVGRAVCAGDAAAARRAMTRHIRTGLKWNLRQPGLDTGGAAADVHVV